MNKRELVSAVTEVLKQNGIKKTIRMPKQKFTISDNEGNSKDFTVKKSDKTVKIVKFEDRFFFDILREKFHLV